MSLSIWCFLTVGSFMHCCLSISNWFGWSTFISRITIWSWFRISNIVVSPVLRVNFSINYKKLKMLLCSCNLLRICLSIGRLFPRKLTISLTIRKNESFFNRIFSPIFASIIWTLSTIWTWRFLGKQEIPFPINRRAPGLMAPTPVCKYIILSFLFT